MQNTNSGNYYDSDFLNSIFVIKYNKFSNKDIKDNLLNNIIKYLDIKDIYNLKISCKTLSNAINEKLIKKYFKLLHISGYMRCRVWSKYLNINDLKEKLSEEYKTDKDNLYKKILLDVSLCKLSTNNDEKTKLLKISFDDISRDINRTFHNERFDEKGKIELTNVLESLSYVKRNIGYCQGMNFIAGALIYIFDCQETAFWIFLSFLDNYEITNLFVKNMPDYNLRVFQLNYYVKIYFPEIYYHFKNNMIPFDLFYSKWFITIFSSYLDFNLLSQCWLYFTIDKWKAVIKTCLIILSELQGLLIKMTLEEISLFIREEYSNYHKNIKEYIKIYNSNIYKVTNKEMKNLKDTYYINLAKDKLANNNSKWDYDQVKPLQSYITEKNKIDMIIKKEIENFKNIMEDTDKKYSVIYNNFIEQHKICMKKKSIIENLIESKIKYENVFFTMIKELHNIEMIKDMDRIKTNEKSFFGNFWKMNKNKDVQAIMKKKQLIEIEANRIRSKILVIQEELDKINNELRELYDVLDTKKYQLEKISNEKEKKKELLEKYLELYEKKENELIAILCEKLKNSENFQKNFKF